MQVGGGAHPTSVARRHDDMETVIALLRNGGCTVKDLLEGRTNWLMEPSFGPMSPIEVFIAPLQFAAVVYNLSAAVPYVTSACGTWLTSVAPSELQWEQAISVAKAASSNPTACAIAQNMLSTEMATARRKTRVMMAKLVLGTAFVVLTLLTMKRANITVVYWILTALELALLVFLSAMADGVSKGRQLAADKHRLARQLEAHSNPSLTGASALPLLLGPACGIYLPDSPWLAPLPSSDPFGVDAVGAHIASIVQLEASVQSALKSKRKVIASQLAAESAAQYRTTALDAVVFVLNAIPFIGYGMHSVVYFISEATVAAVLPAWPGHSVAQYWGNLAGDVAWTIEAALMLVVPRMISRMTAATRMDEKKAA